MWELNATRACLEAALRGAGQLVRQENRELDVHDYHQPLRGAQAIRPVEKLPRLSSRTPRGKRHPHVT